LTDDEADHRVDVDPDEVTDPESEINAEEDIGDRVDVHSAGSDPEESATDDAEPTDADGRTAREDSCQPTCPYMPSIHA